MLLRDATIDDILGLLAIYNHAVAELDAIWTEQLDTLAEREAWFRDRTEAGYPVLVAVSDDGQVIGYGTFGEYRSKPGYRLTVEHSVYIAANAQGQGVGKAMLARLIEIAKADGYHLMVAVIEDQNDASVHLHTQLGFVPAGHLPQSGMKKGRWLGELMMYLTLDERTVPPGKL